MNTGHNPSLPDDVPCLSLSREVRVCLAVVVACHLLLVGWIVFGGFETKPDVVPPMMGMLLSGGSGTGSGGDSGSAGESKGGSQAAHAPVRKNRAKNLAGKQENSQASKPQTPSLSHSGKNAGIVSEKKATAPSASPGNVSDSPSKQDTPATGGGDSGTGRRAEAGADIGTGTGTGRANGTGEAGGSGNGGKGFSGPYADAGFFSNPKPPYPPASRRMAEEGTVLLSVHIRSDGQVDEVKLKRSSGFSRLDDSAIRTVRKWRYIPARRNGQAIPYWYIQPIRFSLDD